MKYTTITILILVIVLKLCSINSLYHTNMKEDMKGRNDEKHDEMPWVLEYRKTLDKMQSQGVPDNGYHMVLDKETLEMTGMQYKIIGYSDDNAKNKHIKVEPNDKIKVLYKLYLLHNKHHIHSLSHVDNPFEIIVGHKRIFSVQSYEHGHSFFHEVRHNKHIEEGFEEIIEHHMHYGERARLIIPPEKAHGSHGHYMKGIPPNAYLEMYLEILPYEEERNEEL
jgi:hypothetical protein